MADSLKVKAILYASRYRGCYNIKMGPQGHFLKVFQRSLRRPMEKLCFLENAVMP